MVTFDSLGPTDYLDLIYQKNINSNKGSSYKLSYEAIGSGNIMTYVFGNTANGDYQDNAHLLTLTNSWNYHE